MLLDIQNINKSYGDRAVLQQVNLQLQRGEDLAITGPSGSGKTTLLNLIAAIDKAESGRILFEGQDITPFTPAQVDHYRREQMGIVFQQHCLIDQCTAIENVILPCLSRSCYSYREAKERAQYFLHRAHIEHCRDRFPSQLSGGECQRVAVCRALINAPKLLLADEPTGSLDHNNAIQLIDLLKSMIADDMSLIMVTHWDQAASQMTRHMELQQGQLITCR